MTATEKDQRAAVIAEARTWLRTEYHHQAHVKGGGVDCAWFLIEVYAAAGLIERFDPGYYPSDWMMHRDEERYLAWVEKYAHRVDAPQPGDLAVWKFGRTFSHGAIVLDWPTIIHAYRRERCVTLGDGVKGDFEAPREVLFYSFWGGE